MAADDGVCEGPNMTLLRQRNRIPPDTVWMPSSASTAHDDLGMNCMVTFENVAGADSMDTAFSIPIVEEEHGNEDSDICFPPPVKKRRLTTKQVEFLERSFEAENKLEPERKMQLAKELGLQPRQVAIWFQNRRARFRNKQLEKDYMSLRASFDQLKSDYDNLIKENENLRTEVLSLKEKCPSREKGIEKQEPVDDDDDGGNSPIAELQTPVANPAEMVSNVLPVVAIKQEEASSAKSDVFDPDRSPSSLEPTDSSHVLEPDQSDFSQDEEDNSLSRNLLPQPYFLNFYQDPRANSCNFEFPVEDQSLWSWNY